jgi:hypothetical protein
MPIFLTQNISAMAMELTQQQILQSRTLQLYDISGSGPVGDGDIYPGHSCLVVPDPPSSVVDGNNATFRLWYKASPEEEGGRA